MRRPGPVVLIAAVVALSTAAPLIRAAAPAPALTVAALRVSLAALALAALGARQLGTLARLDRRQQLMVAGAGLLLAIHFGAWITSLFVTSTAASLALVATNPVFAAGLGALLGDRVGRREWLGIVVAAAGCAILTGGDWQAGGDALIGDGLALIGAVTAAGYLVVGRSLRSALPLFPYLAAVNGVAGALLLVAALIAGVPMIGWPAGSYVAIAASALFASVGGHSLLNQAVRHTPAHLVALAVLGEPVGATLLTWATLGEVPPWTAAAGGAVILVGIGVGFVGRRGPIAPADQVEAPGRARTPR